MAEKIVGILGGMGPEATVDLMQRIIRLTPALDDIDHIRCIVDNNPKVPSRIKALIEGNGENPGPCMADMGKRLQDHGADFLVIACNTAHFYYDYVQEAVNIPVLHMIDLVAEYVTEKMPEQKRIGLLASPAVAMTGLYAKRFKNKGIQDVWPAKEAQAVLLDVIKAVKKGDTGDRVMSAYERVCVNLKENGVQTAVIACTELSAISAPQSIETVDAAQVLAAAIVKTAKGA